MTEPTGGLAALIEALEDHARQGLDPEVVATLLAAADVDDAALAPHLGFCGERYARHPVHRSEDFDVLVLCWEPGQETRVHDHSGQRGWVRVLQGAIEEIAYELAPAAEVEVPPGASAAACRLREAGRTLVPAGRAVASVDRARAIHRLGNPAGRGERAVTLHVYSKPHDSCMAYDLDRGTSERMELSTDG